jgi:imidazolonepropionase-like amidohydrolase
MATRKPRPILITNASIVDGSRDRAEGGMSVLIEGDVIREVSAKPITSASAQVIDFKGKTLMHL